MKCTSFFGHDFPKWSAPTLRTTHQYIHDLTDTNVTSEDKNLVQERTCKRCGLYELRRVNV